MGVWQSFVIALGMLRLHKMRAFLTMLGVIIGVMSVTIIIMLSEGFQSYIQKQFSKIGSDTIFVFYNPSRLNRGEAAGDIEKLTLADIDYIRERVPAIILTAGLRDVGTHKLKFGETEVKDVRVRAVDENFTELNRIPLLQGRLLTAEDNEARNSVAVISDDVAIELFPNRDALGQLFQMDGIALTVVGVTEKTELMGERSTKSVLLPLRTARSKWLGGNDVDLILLRAKPGLKLNDVMQDVWEALMAKTGNKAVYNVESSENILKVFQGIIGGAGTLLAAIAALSLLVGGIGIMNIMLVSVTERTKEIGLRKAIGARKASVLMQFLIEAGTLSLVGGLIGMGCAYGVGLLVQVLTAAREFPDKGGLPATFPLPAALGAMGFSALIGMVFGFYPAVAAARLDPIVALRHE